MKKVLLVCFIVLFIIACRQAEPIESPEPTTDQEDQVTQLEQKDPQLETVVKKPILPEIEPSDNMSRPDVEEEKAKDTSVIMEEMTKGMELGEHVLQVTGEEFTQDFKCDLSTNMLSFTMVNTVDRTYSLIRKSVFDLEDGVYPMRVSINGREIRDFNVRCGGKEALAPGESAKCSLVFAPNSLVDRVMVRVGPDEFGKPLINNLKYTSSYDRSLVQFVCPEK